MLLVYNLTRKAHCFQCPHRFKQNFLLHWPRVRMFNPVCSLPGVSLATWLLRNLQNSPLLYYLTLFLSVHTDLDLWKLQISCVAEFSLSDPQYLKLRARFWPPLKMPSRWVCTHNVRYKSSVIFHPYSHHQYHFPPNQFLIQSSILEIFTYLCRINRNILTSIQTLCQNPECICSWKICRVASSQILWVLLSSTR